MARSLTSVVTQASPSRLRLDPQPRPLVSIGMRRS